MSGKSDLDFKTVARAGGIYRDAEHPLYPEFATTAPALGTQRRLQGSPSPGGNLR